jgi:O-antigen ligase
LSSDAAQAADRSARGNALRIAIPIARFDVPPKIAAISRWLPGVLLAVWVLTLPLEFTKLYFPNQAIELSRIVLVLCLVAFGVQIVIEREVRIPASAGILGLALFIAYAGVSAASVGSIPGTKTVAAMAAYLLMMLAIFNWTRTSTEHRRIWSALAVSVVIISLVGLVFHSTNTYIWNAPDLGVARVNATFRDPNIFARFLSFGMLAMVVLAADLDVSIRQRAIWIAAAIAAAITLPFTYSRAGWAFTLVVALVVIVLARRRRRALALVGLVVAVFAAVAIIDPSVFSRAALLAANLTSPFNDRPFLLRAPWLRFLSALPLDSVRQYLIGAGLIMFSDHPIFGVGFGTFSQALSGQYSSLIPLGFDTTASHTSVITILAETGLIGLALVMLTGFFFIRSVARGTSQSPAQRTLVLAPLIALLLIVLDSQFSGRLVDESYLWLFLGLAYSARAGLEDDALYKSEIRSR